MDPSEVVSEEIDEWLPLGATAHSGPTTPTQTGVGAESAELTGQQMAGIYLQNHQPDGSVREPFDGEVIVIMALLDTVHQRLKRSVENGLFLSLDLHPTAFPIATAVEVGQNITGAGPFQLWGVVAIGSREVIGRDGQIVDAVKVGFD